MQSKRETWYVNSRMFFSGCNCIEKYISLLTIHFRRLVFHSKSLKLSVNYDVKTENPQSTLILSFSPNSKIKWGKVTHQTQIEQNLNFITCNQIEAPRLIRPTNRLFSDSQCFAGWIWTIHTILQRLSNVVNYPMASWDWTFLHQAYVTPPCKRINIFIKGRLLFLTDLYAALWSLSNLFCRNQTHLIRVWTYTISHSSFIF